MEYIAKDLKGISGLISKFSKIQGRRVISMRISTEKVNVLIVSLDYYQIAISNLIDRFKKDLRTTIYDFTFFRLLTSYPTLMNEDIDKDLVENKADFEYWKDEHILVEEIWYYLDSIFPYLERNAIYIS